MEASTEKKKPNLYIIFVGIVIFFLCILGYFSFFKTSPIPATFFSKYHEQAVLVAQTLPLMQFNYGLLSEQIQAQNASGAANLSKENLIQALKNKESEKAISTKNRELKVLLSSVTDTTIREKIIKLFGLLDERDEKMRNVIDIQVSIFTTLRNHFGAMAVGGKPSEMPQNIDSVIQASQKEFQDLMQIQTSIDVAYQEIVKLADAENDMSNSSTADSIRMSLSATPMQNAPVVTDFPTPTPAPTDVPTASPSADPATTATPSAQ